MFLAGTPTRNAGQFARAAYDRNCAAKGHIRSIDNVVSGFENTPRALRDMLTGASTGKTLVRYADGQHEQAST